MEINRAIYKTVLYGHFVGIQLQHMGSKICGGHATWTFSTTSQIQVVHVCARMASLSHSSPTHQLLSKQPCPAVIRVHTRFTMGERRSSAKEPIGHPFDCHKRLCIAHSQILFVAPTKVPQQHLRLYFVYHHEAPQRTSRVIAAAGAQLAPIIVLTGERALVADQARVSRD